MKCKNCGCDMSAPKDKEPSLGLLIASSEPVKGKSSLEQAKHSKEPQDGDTEPKEDDNLQTRIDVIDELLEHLDGLKEPKEKESDEEEDFFA